MSEDMLMVPRAVLVALLARPAGRSGPREYTRHEARVSVLLDLDSKGAPKSQRRYADEWNWTRGQVRERWDDIVGTAESWYAQTRFTTQQQPNNNPKDGLNHSVKAVSQPNNNPTTTQKADFEADETPPDGSLSPTPPFPPLPPPFSQKEKNPKGFQKKKGFSLPDWIDPDVWRAWKDFRTRKKQPLTDRAVALQLGKLGRFREAGQDPNAILDQSIENGWTGLYALKTDGRNGTTARKTKRYDPDQNRRDHLAALQRLGYDVEDGPAGPGPGDDGLWR